MKPADGLVIGVILVIIIALSLQVYRNTGDVSHVLIEARGEVWMYPLDEDLHAQIPGPLGYTDVVIEDGKVHVPASPCRDKICISMGEISRPGQWIICLPNDVFVRVEGIEPEDREVDDVAF